MGCLWAKSGPKLAVSDFVERIFQELLGQFPPVQVYFISKTSHKNWAYPLDTTILAGSPSRPGKTCRGVSSSILCGTRISTAARPIFTNSSLFETYQCLNLYWVMFIYSFTHIWAPQGSQIDQTRLPIKARSCSLTNHANCGHSTGAHASLMPCYRKVDMEFVMKTYFWWLLGFHKWITINWISGTAR